MPDRDLKLNSLSRFSKKSPRLVLEEYSHCEVPAGCGGVVLRWRKPEAPIPMKIHVGAFNGFSRNRTLDGKEDLGNPKIPVSYGKHVLAIEINNFKPDHAIEFMYSELNEDYVRILKPEGETTILSLPDDTWRFTLDTPDIKWQDPDYDDSHWSPLVQMTTHADPRFGDMSNWTKRIADKGAIPLGLDMDNTTIREKVERLLTTENVVEKVFIRKTFTITESKQNNGDNDNA